MNAFDQTLTAHQAYNALPASPLAQAAAAASIAHFGGHTAELLAGRDADKFRQGFIHGARGSAPFATDGAYGAGYAAGVAA